MPVLERRYGVESGYSGETKEEALDKVSDARDEVEGFKDEFRPFFESEFEKSVPRHPFKLMMVKRKELGLYRHFQYSRENSLMLRALFELKEEFLPVWESLASGGSE